LPLFGSAETKATDIQVTEKENAYAIFSFSITKTSLPFKLIPVLHNATEPTTIVNVCGKSLFKIETKETAKTSPVLHTATSELGARAPSHGPSHPGL